MAVSQLEALAVDTRRTIFGLLCKGPRSVRDIADDLPVSRPAVSQHLRVLLDAQLVRVERIGNRRLYSIDTGGLGELRAWIDDMWDAALTRYSELARAETEGGTNDQIDDHA